MGGGGQYPYPQWVWTPTGGWWSLPNNWRRNTFLLGLSGAGLVVVIWRYTGNREVRHNPPTRWIPSMMWSPGARKAYEDGQRSGVSAARLGVEAKPLEK